MMEILLEEGVSTTVLYKGKTALQVLFESLASYRNMRKRDQYHMFKIIKTFLRNGYDPNTRIAFQPHHYPTTYKCSPLHVALVDLIHLLLKYRADINNIGMNGHSPLDIAISRDDALASSLI